MANSLLAEQLVAHRARRGQLVAIAVHPERRYDRAFQLITQCDCGNKRIVTVTDFKRSRNHACEDCTKARHRAALSEAAAARHVARKKLSSQGNPQVEALLAQRVQAHQRLGVEFDITTLRKEIERECAEFDFADLLHKPKFRIELLRGSSLATAI